MSGQTNGGPTHVAQDENLAVYNSSAIAEHYAALAYLSACEQEIFKTHLKPGMDILDLGVGGGRTTPYLSSIARRYVGVDYAEKMVAACRAKFPGLEFRTGDATDLSPFRDGSFDAVVFAFNGIDCIASDAARKRCLQECRRVLRDEGVLVFSTHNPQALFVRPLWDRQRVRAFAERLTGAESSMLGVATAIVNCGKAIITAVRSVKESAVRMLQRVPRAMFWTGAGWMREATHGGLNLHYALPARVVAETEEQGFRLRQVLGDDYPRVSRRYITDWYYYVFVRK